MSALLAWILALVASLGGISNGTAPKGDPRTFAPAPPPSAHATHPVLPMPSSANGNLPISNGL